MLGNASLLALTFPIGPKLVVIKNASPGREWERHKGTKIHRVATNTVPVRTRTNTHTHTPTFCFIALVHVHTHAHTHGVFLQINHTHPGIEKDLLMCK